MAREQRATSNASEAIGWRNGPEYRGKRVHLVECV